MNIIHIINALEVGGAERLLVDTLPVMKSMGHNIKVVLLFSTGSNFEKQLLDAGIDVEALDLKRGAYDPRIISRLYRYMADADVVHSHLFPSQYWAALTHCLRRHSVLVTTEHSTSNTRTRYWLTSLLDRCIYGMYDGIICISDATAHFMQQRAPKHVMIEVIENGIKLPSAEELHKSISKRSNIVEKLPEDAFVVLQVARFSDQKNQDCVIRALPLLPQNVHIVFAGYGKRLEECKQLAKSLHVDDRTYFLGMREDIAQLWSIADIGVMSSHWEGFGLAAVEGMAYGKPVIASNVPGLAEVIGNNNLLFEPNSEQQFADIVMRFYNDPTYKEECKKACIAQANKFDIKTMAMRYINFYNKILEKKKAK